MPIREKNAEELEARRVVETKGGRMGNPGDDESCREDGEGRGEVVREACTRSERRREKKRKTPKNNKTRSKEGHSREVPLVGLGEGEGMLNEWGGGGEWEGEEKEGKGEGGAEWEVLAVDSPGSIK